MKINIEEKSGFCFGVRKAIELAEELLNQGETVYCLGEIVHNEIEVSRLRQKGLIFIDHGDLKSLRNATVLFRAHGEPPETYEIARQNNLKVVDGTCPIVQAIQKKIRKKAMEDSGEKKHIVIYGKEGHPEVLGLKGHAGNQAIVLKEPEDIKKIPEGGSVILFSQTTMDTKGFQELGYAIQSSNAFSNTEIHNTICRHISHREPGLRTFARSNDVIVFVSGKNSSNGKILYEICRGENPHSYFISDTEEIKPEWFAGVQSIGISGATSTPVWLLEDVAEILKGFTKT